MSNQAPPKWAERFLKWYCNPVYLEEIEGDIYELFDRRIETEQPKTAKIKFIWDVIRFFRWANIKRSNSKFYTMNQLVLLSNYMKLGFRSIQKNLVSSAINILGLALAIGIAITTFIFVDMQFSMDQFHSKKDRIYQITNFVEQDNEEASLWSDSPITLGPALKKDHSVVEDFARMEFETANVRYGDNVFEEFLAFVDPQFLEIFDFPMLYGNDQVLKDKTQVLISRDMAIKYFDDEDPIGKELSFKFPTGEIKRFTVASVLAKYPYNSGMRFDFLLPIANFYDLHQDRHYGWEYLTDATFVLLQPGHGIHEIVDSFDGYREIQLSSNPEWKVRKFEAMPFTEISLRGWEIVGSVSGGSHPAGRVALIVIAGLLLSMACFNFMNISIAASTKRLKEIALRKAMGGVRKQIIHQFLVENILQCFFALVFGTLLAYFFLVPGFDSLIPPLDIQFRTGSPWSMVIFFTSLLLAIAFLSGGYPAFYISKFQPIAIFRGNEKFGASNLFSKILLGFQLFLAFQTIVGSFLFLDQSMYNSEKDWGYDPSNTFSVKVMNTEQAEKLNNQIRDHADVLSTTFASGQLGRSMPSRSFEYLDKQFTLRALDVSENYFETMGMRLVAGRFLTASTFDQENALVVNETFVERMEWSDPINETVVFDSVKYTVVGVVQDFHYYNFFVTIDPVIFKGIGNAQAQYLAVRTKENKQALVDDYTKQQWLTVSPYDAYDRVFQEDVFDGFFQENQANIAIIAAITICAIMLACLGLYGLLAFNIQKKLKEFSVRKVLGATPKAIATIASKQYSWIVLIAFALGAPLGVMGMQQLINSVFPHAKGITAFPFVVSFVLIVGTLTLTVAGQVLKAIKVNPASNLRAE